jgi:hypothetical protein
MARESAVPDQLLRYYAGYSRPGGRVKIRGSNYTVEAGRKCLSDFARWGRKTNSSGGSRQTFTRAPFLHQQSIINNTYENGY